MTVKNDPIVVTNISCVSMMCIHIYIYMYIYIHMYMYIYMYVYVYIYIYICICIYICMCIYIYVCIHVQYVIYMYVYIMRYQEMTEKNPTWTGMRDGFFSPISHESFVLRVSSFHTNDGS